jgi:SEC-C motif-containing protein
MSTSRKANTRDVRVESVLNGMTLEQLGAVRDTLFEQLRTGLPPADRIADALEPESAEIANWFRLQALRGEAVEVVTLLVGLAVASASMEHGGMPASTRRLQEAMARVRKEHVYMLPIPRDDPCFCGSGSRFRVCHGRPPVAAPTAS